MMLPISAGGTVYFAQPDALKVFLYGYNITSKNYFGATINAIIINMLLF